MNQSYETYFNDATELLKQLIATPSVSRDEKAAANIFCNIPAEAFDIDFCPQ